MRHLLRHLHSKYLTELAIVYDYKFHWMLCVALQPHQNLQNKIILYVL